ncbi:MAG: DNA polymerase III subunit delta [Treponema sp.]|jgi:DNA polymerase-3 subunit delta|nr:DNA polymerase III subunit delta [Treponema sp.]
MAAKSTASPPKNAAGCSGNAYVFLGPELGRRQDAVTGVRKRMTGAEETVFYAGETPAGRIAEAVQNHSLFTSSRLFIIKNAEQIKKKDEVELLASCMRSLDEGTVVILISDDTKIAAGLNDAVPKDNRTIFWELFEREKPEWVRRLFRDEGFTIENDGIDTILEMVENNTEALRRECLRLMLFLQKGRSVTAPDVEQWLSHSREESAFTLFSRIASGDISRAVESLHTLLAAKESAQSILAGLAWCFRKLRDYLALLETGEVNNFELKKIGLSSPKARDDYAAAARRYTAAAADACLSLTAEYDILVRSSGNPLEAVLMDAYLLKIFRGGPAADSL